MAEQPFRVRVRSFVADDLKNIEVTAAVCAGLGETAIDYYPQKGLYTAISYAFTDLILLVSMLVQALLLVRQERDSGLCSTG